MTIAGCGGASGEPALGEAAAPPAAPSAADLPPHLLDELAERVVGALPIVADRIPAADAELVGRQGLPDDPTLSTGPVGPATRGLPVVPAPLPQPHPSDPGSVAVPAPEDPGAFLDARVLAAVLPVLGSSSLDAPAELGPFVRPAPRPSTGSSAVLVVTGDGQSVAAGLLRQHNPEVIRAITDITGALTDHDRVAPLLEVGAGREAEVVAAHGRAHLALAVVVSGIVLSAADVPGVRSDPAAVVAGALDAVTPVLRDRPMPGTHAAAALERRRAEYRVPNVAHGQVTVNGYRFGLAEGALPPAAEEPANGLVAVVPGGLVVRTGVVDGPVPVSVQVLPGPPPVEPDGRDLAVWHEVVEVSFTAEAGAASVVSDAGAATSALAERTPPWPGPVRARVSARGRDDGDGERYEIVVWSAPAGPEVVRKATDRLGHRLRGEPEPPVVERPEAAYRWLRDSTLGSAATVTVVTGSSAEQVVAAFGGDPGRPVPMGQDLGAELEPWVAVLPVDGAVIAVEPNGWQGTHDEVLRAASANGRAASMYWSGDGLTNLAFARGGEVVDSFEPLFVHDAPDGEVRAALDGIDWADYTDLHEKGLAAVEGFTGHGIRAQDVDRIEEAAVAFRIPDSG
ncbi:DUF6461 domain-containing protein [Pseudonocardia humida]|uniref:Uncharacterized protein n=1 Tax=Pseudonocardia humida TaxID=2800819 RepID=A0ABT0ZVT6_9PSEU|nr:DUF6461 domain-containing protein [Pseudonocardia humida]MCO1654836.1 hypothetical protein [Pseudonocardia humida]